MFVRLLLVTKNSLSLSVSTHIKKLSDLFASCEVNSTRFSFDPNKVFWIFLHITEDKKSLLCKWLRFFIPPKKIECVDLLAQFKLLCRDTIMFEMKSENHDFLKSKLKNICFSTLKSYSFDKVEKKKNQESSLWH